MRFLAVLLVFLLIPSKVYGNDCEGVFHPDKGEPEKEWKLNMESIKNLNQLDLDKHLEKYDIDTQEPKTGNSLLHRAIEEENSQFIDKLLVRGASPYIINQNLKRAIELPFFQDHLVHLISIDPAHNIPSDKKAKAEYFWRNTFFHVYFAGPEVFLPYNIPAGNFLKAQISLFNTHYLKEKDSPYLLKGHFPFDSEYVPKNMDFQDGVNIFKANIDIMDKSDVIMANMVKFRGPGMDGGTAFEMGYMHAQGKVIVGYYDEKAFYANPRDNRDITEKVEEEIRDVQTKKVDSHELSYDNNNLLIEPFDMPDNLMMVVPSTLEGKSEIANSSWEALFLVNERLLKEKDMVIQNLILQRNGGFNDNYL